jgi:hypothetical protein
VGIGNTIDDTIRALRLNCQLTILNFLNPGLATTGNYDVRFDAEM